jgi:hypothetical protein
LLGFAVFTAFAQAANAQVISSTNSDNDGTKTHSELVTSTPVTAPALNVAATDNLANTPLSGIALPAATTADATDNSESMLSVDGGHRGGSSSGGAVEGKNIVYAGVGFVGGLALIGTLYTAEGYSATSTPTITVAYERGLSAHWGVGLVFNYSSVTLNSTGSIDNTGDYYPNNQGQVYSYTNKYTLTGMAFGLTGAYHFVVSDKCDPYIGAALGYTSIANNYTTNDPNAAYDNGNGTLAIAGSGVLFGGFLGIRYYFTDNIGAWASIGYLGYGGSLLNIGLAAKF